MNSKSINPEIKKWIFIGGAPRSGTSLLQAIMNKHSECVSPPESHILETFIYAATTKTIKDFSNREKLVGQLKKDKWIHRLSIEPQQIVEQLTPDAPMMDIFKLYMMQYAAGFKKQTMVDGSPINIWFLKKLKEDFPGCYILHIVRDPRDVILSTMQADYNAKFNFPPFLIARQFMTGYRNAITFSPDYGDHYLKIYYEDLVTNPEKVIREICDTVKIDFQQSMMEFNKNSEKVYSSEETWKKNLAKPFIKNNFGKWKTDMKQEDLIAAELACKDFFKRESNHYEISEVSKKAGTIKYYSQSLKYYTAAIKKSMREKINSGKTEEELDNLPLFVRLKRKKMLRK